MTQADAMSLEFVRSHAYEAAAVLVALDCGETAAFLEEVPPADAAAVLARFIPQLAAECLCSMPVPAAAAVLEHLAPDLCTLLLRRLDGVHRLAVLAALPAGVAASVRNALRYSEAVVGAVMDASVPVLGEDLTAAAAIELLRRVPAPGNTIFVIDAEQRFTGTLDAARLLVAEGSVPLRELADREVEAFSARLEIADLLQHPVWHHCDTVPVVDQNGLLLGGLRRSALATALAAGRADELRERSPLALLFDCADVFWSACADLFAPAPRGPRERGR
jgi:magnesium transporter